MPLKTRRNPFVARPTFSGRSARFKESEGGFHTARDRDVTVPYAQLKYQTSPYLPHDLPVIYTLNMRGHQPRADVDDRRAAAEFWQAVKLSREDFASIDALCKWVDVFEADPSEEVQEHEDVVNALYKLTSISVFKRAVYAVGNYFERAAREEDLKDFLFLAEVLSKDENASLTADAEQLLVGVFGQAAYFDEVPDEALVSVAYMRPFYSKVFPSEPPDDEDEEESERETITASGLIILESDDSFPPADFKNAWGADVPDDGLQHVQYHGTSLSNLLKTCPWIAKQLKEPPKGDWGDDVVQILYKAVR